MISGIVHMLRIGAPWRTCPSEYGPWTTVYNRFHRWNQPGYLVCNVRSADRALGRGRNRLHQNQGAQIGSGRKRGAAAQGLGISRGGRTSKVHGLTDEQGRPRVLLISPGNTSDMVMAPALIEAARGRFTKLIADCGCDSNAIRAAVKAQGAEAVIPPKRNRTEPL